MHRWGRLSLLLVFVLRPTAQIQSSLSISEPDTQAFPTISLMVSVSDSAGRRIPGLTAGNFQILEDGIPVDDLVVEEVLVGTRQVFVINTAPGLGVRDSHGLTRFDYVRQELLKYWRDPDASLIGVDDLSLLTSDGLLIQHSNAAAELAAALDVMEPTFEGSISGFDLLLLALDFSADPLEAAALPSSLVFMTPSLKRHAIYRSQTRFPARESPAPPSTQSYFPVMRFWNSLRLNPYESWQRLLAVSF